MLQKCKGNIKPKKPSFFFFFFLFFFFALWIHIGEIRSKKVTRNEVQLYELKDIESKKKKSRTVFLQSMQNQRSFRIIYLRYWILAKKKKWPKVKSLWEAELGSISGPLIQITYSYYSIACFLEGKLWLI